MNYRLTSCNLKILMVLSKRRMLEKKSKKSTNFRTTATKMNKSKKKNQQQTKSIKTKLKLIPNEKQITKSS